ncbi:MAG: hypothetical protein V4485_06495, partial [Pseudomonadota bacterium]
HCTAEHKAQKLSEIALKLVNLYNKCGKYKEALQLANESLCNNSDDIYIIKAKAEALYELYKTGNFADSALKLEEAARLYGNVSEAFGHAEREFYTKQHIQVLLRASEVYFALGEYERALGMCQQAKAKIVVVEEQQECASRIERAETEKAAKELHASGDSEFDQCNYAEAKREYEEAWGKSHVSSERKKYQENIDRAESELEALKLQSEGKEFCAELKYRHAARRYEIAHYTSRVQKERDEYLKLKKAADIEVEADNLCNKAVKLLAEGKYLEAAKQFVAAVEKSQVVEHQEALRVEATKIVHEEYVQKFVQEIERKHIRKITDDYESATQELNKISGNIETTNAKIEHVKQDCSTIALLVAGGALIAGSVWVLGAVSAVVLLADQSTLVKSTLKWTTKPVLKLLAGEHTQNEERKKLLPLEKEMEGFSANKERVTKEVDILKALVDLYTKLQSKATSQIPLDDKYQIVRIAAEAEVAEQNVKEVSIMDTIANLRTRLGDSALQEEGSSGDVVLYNASHNEYGNPMLLAGELVLAE